MRRFLSFPVVVLLAASAAVLDFLGGSVWGQASRGLTIEEMRSERRVALVIGNGAYDASPLRNPVNDARAMAQALRDLGFEVLAHENLTQKGMKKAIVAFGDRLQGSGVGLFYYAGHGMQVGGRNYLIPVGTEIKAENEVEVESVDVSAVLARMETARSRVSIAILDSCRDNPFARSFRSSARGLASIDAPSGTIIAYATAPGKVSSDGDGTHGLYTGELLKAIRMPDVKIEETFKRVRQAVQQQTRGQQTPWESSSLVGDFVFALSKQLAKKSERVEGKAPPEARESGDTKQREMEEQIKRLADAQARQEQESRKLAEQLAEERRAAEERAKQEAADREKQQAAERSKLEAERRQVEEERKRVVEEKARLQDEQRKAAESKRSEALERQKIEEARVRPPSAPGQTGREITGQDGAPMVLVPAGEFRYGDNNQRMSLSAFYMDKYELTTNRYAKFLQDTGREKPAYWNEVRLTSHGDRPVVGVTWHDADAYCRHYGKRLPTEQEWEKAARGTDGRKYPWGNDEPTSRHANFGKSGADQYDLLVNVGALEDGKSPYGIYDMAGNVWEWTSSDEGSNKVFRGGSCSTRAVSMRSSDRLWGSLAFRGASFGFRCAQDAR